MLDRERISKQNVVATLRLRIKTLEEKNRELTALLELAYGKLVLSGEKNVPHSADFERFASAIQRNLGVARDPRA
jgi:hypothetical protein